MVWLESQQGFPNLYCCQYGFAAGKLILLKYLEIQSICVVAQENTINCYDTPISA